MTLRVILADDHPIFRDGLVASIEETGEFEVVGVGETAEDAIRLAKEMQPDVALLDLSMPGGGIQAARAIRAAGTAAQVAMLTVSEDDSDVMAALNAGVTGYVLKGVSAEELRRVLKRIAKGEAHITPSLAAQVLKLMQAAKVAEPNPIDTLSKREEDILRRVAKGMSNREIAEGLSLQEKTVKHYMTEILSKLHARNRVEAAIIAHEAWRDQD
ncbi:response regulator transcription factor [Loktanella sp. IMCC34160]|uniref:response regulator n=1 Tax=Loktanella sp. IMCC34160 TaxID=2510646 RepID=UPI00101C5EE7|nr:response regulator transcription factor [Loktanella sp. IMCC34160]RYG92263.1 response regulator transcription factor [Loktanella sp. IMCC34160]